MLINFNVKIRQQAPIYNVALVNSNMKFRKNIIAPEIIKSDNVF